MTHHFKIALATLLYLFTVALSANDATLKLRIIETTDLHSNVMDFDYYKDKPTAKTGLVRTATLIKQARVEVANSVLVDNGDLIQGSPMGDYIADRGLNANQIHPVYQAMNLLDYDAANICNHEFNYGLAYLQKVLTGAKFPYINANIYTLDGKQSYFTPYLIKSYNFKDEAGKFQSIKMGFIGFVPPQILKWDRVNLHGKISVKDFK